ncbi:LysR family transcriptional regulator [Nocardia sp. NEAU-351]|uniref:LysR family transcriptional regulator n=2 Tax=Nocardia bovistercoris TaxID=2785916 RepID=A0A931MYS6_9NOCA|nr:LysR family transcriptional regulator [Nocardia bovistercoris]
MSRFDSIDPTRLRWFSVVAEELHFARAAKALNISRQRLSRTVIELEEELGTKLFVPGAQPTQLTDDGRVLLEQAPDLIAAAEVVAIEPESVTAASLRVGFVPGVTVSKWTRIWAERFPDAALETVPVAAAEQLDALCGERVDMCFVRLPIDRDGLSAIPLYREVPVVVVPKDHPVSVFAEVGMADLADERVQEDHAVDDAAITLEMVAAGVGLAIVPHSIARLHARRDLVYRTVTDAPDTEIALAWLTERTRETFEDFVGVVRGRSERSSRSPARVETAGRGAKSTGGRGGVQKAVPARRAAKKIPKRRSR